MRSLRLPARLPKARWGRRNALTPLLTGVMLFIDDVNHELDRLEGDLMKLFPGDTTRVASYIAATRHEHSGAPAQPEPPLPIPLPVPITPKTP